MRHTLILQEERDGTFVAWIPTLPGCACEGNSREEALSNIKLQIVDYYAECRALAVQSQEITFTEHIEVEIPDVYSAAAETPEAHRPRMGRWRKQDEAARKVGQHGRFTNFR